MSAIAIILIAIGSFGIGFASGILFLFYQLTKDDD